MKNPLYGDPDQWDKLALSDQLEWIRKHLCTGPCGQSSQVMTQRSRMDKTFHAVGVLVESCQVLEDRAEGWKELAKCRDDLLVCYRIGKQPAGKLLDQIRRLEERLGANA